MKSIAKLVSVAVLGSLLPLAAQVTETREDTETRRNADGTTTQTDTTTTTTTFDPDSRTKVVKYFDTYKGERYGMPPAWVTNVRAKDLPAEWRTTRIAPGMVITEKNRTYLMKAPPELIKVLPTPRSEDVTYYMAGGNVVAVDKGYKVVDSIHIPSIKITVDD